MNYEIIPLKLGEFPHFELSSLLYMTQQGTKIRAPITAWLIRGEGKKILVDTGPCDPAWSAKHHHTIEVSEEMKLESALKLHGVALADIHCVVLTHLHWDHCFGNHLFPDIKFYVQRTEFDYAMDPLPLHRVGYESFQAGLCPPWHQSMSQFEFVHGDLELFPGITLVALPSHTPGSQGVLVAAQTKRYLIAGDCIGSYANWEGTRDQKHIVGGVHVNLRDYYATYEKIERMGVEILPGHDMRVFEKKAYQ